MPSFPLPSFNATGLQSSDTYQVSGRFAYRQVNGSIYAERFGQIDCYVTGAATIGLSTLGNAEPFSFRVNDGTLVTPTLTPSFTNPPAYESISIPGTGTRKFTLYCVGNTGFLDPSGITADNVTAFDGNAVSFINDTGTGFRSYFQVEGAYRTSDDKLLYCRNSTMNQSLRGELSSLELFGANIGVWTAKLFVDGVSYSSASSADPVVSTPNNWGHFAFEVPNDGQPHVYRIVFNGTNQPSGYAGAWGIRYEGSLDTSYNPPDRPGALFIGDSTFKGDAYIVDETEGVAWLASEALGLANLNVAVGGLASKDWIGSYAGFASTSGLENTGVVEYVFYQLDTNAINGVSPGSYADEDDVFESAKELMQIIISDRPTSKIVWVGPWPIASPETLTTWTGTNETRGQAVANLNSRYAALVSQINTRTASGMTIPEGLPPMIFGDPADSGITAAGLGDGLHWTEEAQATQSQWLAGLVGNSGTITSVTVSPATATLYGGQTQQFAAVVEGEEGADLSVTWSTELGSISSDGLLTSPAPILNTPQVFDVTATSVENPSKSDTATVTVPAAITANLDSDPPYIGHRFL